MRESIGAALQEAALDPLLTGREHMRLQTALHGLPKRERVARGDELLERVGLADAGRPQGRRLLRRHEAPPRPRARARALARASSSSTSRRPASTRRAAPTCGTRSAGWRARTASPCSSPRSTSRRPTCSPTASGSSTTGRIVAEGTPEALKAEIGRPSLEVDPRPTRAAATASPTVLARFGEPVDAPRRRVAVRLERGADELADVVRALDAEDVGIAHFQLHAPSLDDVFLAKTGPLARGREDGDRRARGGAGLSDACSPRSARSRGARSRQTLRQPALIVPPILFPLCLLAVNAGGLDAATKLPGFPTDSYLDFALAIPFMQGALFAAINAGPEPGARRRDRLPQPARADADAARRAAARPARRRDDGRAGVVADLPRRRPRRRAGHRGRRRRRARAGRAGAPDRARLRRARRARRAAHRLGRGGPGPLPAALRPPLPVLAGAARDR